ncbi:MAG: hypothetical protein U9R79_07425, partial [Armatimonadota bacterium]|nr:hypothetical protein [Armatimonadota bacterium]
EAQALERATAELGAAPVAECQTAVNELPGGAVPSVERELRQLMRRAASAGAGGSEPPDLSPMAPVIAEQVLQADLLASMAIGECASPPEVLVESLHSRSAVVREAAERLLARQGKRAAPALRQVLESAPDPPVAARALEVLRCIEEPALGHAREAAGADHELLRAAGVKCLGAGGGEDDVEAVVSAAGDRSELVQIVAVEGLGALDPASHIDVLFEALGSPRFSVRDKAMQALARLELERLERLARRAEEEGNHWQRVGMSGMVESLRAGGDPAARRWRGVPFAVAGDWELGARMAVAGDGPWQWGLTGLCPESAERFDLYADLLEKDEELREAWEVWMRTGNFPYKPLPRLQEIAAEGGPNSEAAIWLAIDALHAAIWGEVFVPASDYYRMTVDEDLLEQVADMASRVFRLCTPEVVAQLAVPNPSAASVWPEVMAPGDPEAAGDRLVRAFVEELKARMRREFGRQVALPDDEGAFRRAIEREWERLLPHQDLFYGFRVVPEVRLEDFGRYCGDRACNREYRRMISSYLAYLATAAPCPRETRSAAREALRGAYSSRLRAAAQEITKDQAADFKAAIDNLEASLERALDEFDIYWASPQPLMPLGTLDMAWAEPRQVPEGRRTDLPERHLPFAHMVEQLVQDVIRQFRERAEYLTEAALGKEDEAPPSLEEIAAAGLSREAGYRGDFVEGLIDGTESAEVVARQLGSIDHEEAPVQVSRLPIDGEDVACVDIREASRLLSRSMDTLRRREDAGEFTFVRHEGRRYLPLDQLPAVRVVVRSMKEWEQILGVSRQTVHTWMSELPDHLDPLEMEARLLERARRRGR